MAGDAAKEALAVLRAHLEENRDTYGLDDGDINKFMSDVRGRQGYFGRKMIEVEAGETPFAFAEAAIGWASGDWAALFEDRLVGDYIQAALSAGATEALIDKNGDGLDFDDVKNLQAACESERALRSEGLGSLISQETGSGLDEVTCTGVLANLEDVEMPSMPAQVEAAIKAGHQGKQ